MEIIKRAIDIKLDSENIQAKMHAKYMKKYKPVFIYGPEGKGRYLNSKGIDEVKISDAIVSTKRRIFPKSAVSKQEITPNSANAGNKTAKDEKTRVKFMRKKNEGGKLL